MRRFLAAGLLLMAAALPALGSHRRPSRKSPHEEITGILRAETAPKRLRHPNGRDFEEFDATLEGHRIHVVHDLSCGGKWLDFRPGDRLDVQGELVHPPDGRDILHFTHPAGAGCGTPRSHPDGYLRPAGP
jgi:hypothetical protein